MTPKPEDGLVRMRAANRFRNVSLIVVALLLASALLGPHYSLAGFAIPVGVTAIALFYFHHRTVNNTEQAVAVLGGLLILFAWGNTIIGAHNSIRHRDIEQIACENTRGTNAEYRCAEIRDLLSRQLFPTDD